jgi:hypothetical protein
VLASRRIIGKPPDTSSRCGNVRRKPKFTPHAIRLNLGAASLEVLARALPVVRETVEAMELA